MDYSKVETAMYPKGENPPLRSPKRLKIDQQLVEEEEEEDGWDTESSHDREKYNTNARKLYVDDLNKEQIQQLLTYYAEAYDSYGFDITTEPPRGHGILRPLLRLNETIDPSLEKNIMIRANAAIDSYNKRFKDKKKRLAFHSLKTANLQKGLGRFYYITLQAKDTSTGKIKTYQTRVRSFQDDPDDPRPIMTVQVFRRPPKREEEGRNIYPQVMT